MLWGTLPGACRQGVALPRAEVALLAADSSRGDGSQELRRVGHPGRGVEEGNPPTPSPAACLGRSGTRIICLLCDSLPSVETNCFVHGNGLSWEAAALSEGQIAGVKGARLGGEDVP